MEIWALQNHSVWISVLLRVHFDRQTTKVWEGRPETWLLVGLGKHDFAFYQTLLLPFKFCDNDQTPWNLSFEIIYFLIEVIKRLLKIFGEGLVKLETLSRCLYANHKCTFPVLSTFAAWYAVGILENVLHIFSQIKSEFNHWKIMFF